MSLYKVVFQLCSSDYLEQKSTMSQVINVLVDLDDIEIEVMVHGNAVPFLLRNSNLKLNIEDLQKKGVMFLICRNSMNKNQLNEKDLLNSVEIVSSGVSHLVKRQSEGWAYLKAGF